MDVKQLAQASVDQFNDRSFRTTYKDVAAPNIVVMDTPSGQSMTGPDGFLQYSESFVKAMPDIKGTAIEQKVNGNKVSTRVRAKGTFTGTFQTPQMTVPGNGKKLDIEYTLDQEFNDAGKLVRFTVNYDMKDFMRQLGMG
jgi:predicted ester cyclase